MNCIVELKSVCKLEFKALPAYLLFDLKFKGNKPKSECLNWVEIKVETKTFYDFWYSNNLFDKGT